MVWFLLAALGSAMLLVWAERGAVPVPAGGAPADDGNEDDPMTQPTPIDPPATSSGVQALAVAIANAEGFGVAGAIPTRAHNPGDLVIPGWTGATLGSERISVFTSDADGWARLRHQLQLIVDGRSRAYRLDMSFTAFAQFWTATEQTIWRDNVLARLQALGYDVGADDAIGTVLLT